MNVIIYLNQPETVRLPFRAVDQSFLVEPAPVVEKRRESAAAGEVTQADTGHHHQGGNGVLDGIAGAKAAAEQVE
ncbi:hypothetical protein NNL38_24475 [Photobacterium atrarenae]|uniref:Uncharacterized protein n=1 Tax=Photobacterium atrarenae TaxID=865757 RepID=A0ABY5GQN5_9GAMM|nr:hypothetical protein [Photobacterium atrarenae]UTV30969.1 hypothetical protein NNL38_24475 [Photobacterium atrarenae]